MNTHVEKMKNAVTNYHKAVKSGMAKIAENTRLYKDPDAANDLIRAQLKKDHDAVISIISDAQDAGRKDADTWAKLDGDKITSDAKLLDAGVVNPAQFKELVKKYSDNSTMLQLLTQYAERKNEENGGLFNSIWGYGGKGNAARSTPQYFDTTGLPTAGSKRAVIDKYAAQAVKLVDSIADFETPGKMGAGPDSPIVLAGLENFGADS